MCRNVASNHSWNELKQTHSKTWPNYEHIGLAAGLPVQPFSRITLYYVEASFSIPGIRLVRCPTPSGEPTVLSPGGVEQGNSLTRDTLKLVSTDRGNLKLKIVQFQVTLSSWFEGLNSPLCHSDVIAKSQGFSVGIVVLWGSVHLTINYHLRNVLRWLPYGSNDYIKKQWNPQQTSFSVIISQNKYYWKKKY